MVVTNPLACLNLKQIAHRQLSFLGSCASPWCYRQEHHFMGFSGVVMKDGRVALIAYVFR